MKRRKPIKIQTLWSVLGTGFIMSGSSSCQLMTLNNKNYISLTWALWGLINIYGQILKLQIKALWAQLSWLLLQYRLTHHPTFRLFTEMLALSNIFGTLQRSRWSTGDGKSQFLLLSSTEKMKLGGYISFELAQCYFTMWLSQIIKAINQI